MELVSRRCSTVAMRWSPPGLQQPDDVAHRADRFRGDALDALEFVGRTGAALGEIGEHLDAAEIAAHLVVEVAGNALAHFQQFAVGMDAVADRQGDDHKRTGQSHQREDRQTGAPPAGDDVRGLGPQRVTAGFNPQPLVEPFEPFAGGNESSVRTKAVAQRGTRPEPAARRDEVLHAVRRTRRLAERDVVVLRKAPRSRSARKTPDSSRTPSTTPWPRF